MKKVIAKYLAIVAVILTLAACGNQPAHYSETGDSTPAEERNTETETIELWQRVYAKLLREYEEKDKLYFLLHDFDRDGMPELIVVGLYVDERYAAVYAFRDGEALALEYEDDVFTADSVLAARGRATAAPGNAPGLIDYNIGPGAGAFGTSTYYTWIVLDGDRLVINARGSRDVDVETLNKLFDDFGRSADDAALDEAIEKHTHYYINDNEVTKEELYSMFESEENLSYSKITEAAISEIIFKEGRDE